MTEKELIELYEVDEDFQEYVQKFMNTHKVSKETAIKDAIVRAVGLCSATLNQRVKEGVTQ